MWAIKTKQVSLFFHWDDVEIGFPHTLIQLHIVRLQYLFTEQHVGLQRISLARWRHLCIIYSISHPYILYANGSICPETYWKCYGPRSRLHNTRVRFWAVQNLFWAGRCPKLGLNPPFTAPNCPKLPNTAQNCQKLPTDYESAKLILG